MTLVKWLPLRDVQLPLRRYCGEHLLQLLLQAIFPQLGAKQPQGEECSKPPYLPGEESTLHSVTYWVNKAESTNTCLS